MWLLGEGASAFPTEPAPSLSVKMHTGDTQGLFFAFSFKGKALTTFVKTGHHVKIGSLKFILDLEF